MATNNPSKKLLNASAQASGKGVHHLLLMVTENGEFRVPGSEDIAVAVYEDTEFFNQLQNKVKENSQALNDATKHMKIFQMVYDPLPCSPYSPEWKGTRFIRGVFRKIMARAGYGKAGHKRTLGVGPAPLGWPADIDWANFKGSTNSGLLVNDITRIIISMLEAAGYDPATHVLPPGQGEIVGGELVEGGVLDNPEVEEHDVALEEVAEEVPEVPVAEELAEVEEYIVEGMADVNQ